MKTFQAVATLILFFSFAGSAAAQVYPHLVCRVEDVVVPLTPQASSSPVIVIGSAPGGNQGGGGRGGNALALIGAVLGAFSGGNPQQQPQYAIQRVQHCWRTF